MPSVRRTCHCHLSSLVKKTSSLFPLKSVERAFFKAGQFCLVASATLSVSCRQPVCCMHIVNKDHHLQVKVISRFIHAIWYGLNGRCSWLNHTVNQCMEKFGLGLRLGWINWVSYFSVKCKVGAVSAHIYVFVCIYVSLLNSVL